MENKNNYKKAKTFILIPLIILVVAVICFIIAGVLEQPTNRGLLYFIFFVISIVCALLGPLLSFIISVFGSIYAFRARVENPKWLLFFLLGIFNVIGSIAIMIGVLYIIFVVGPGV